MEPFKNAFSFQNACLIAEKLLEIHPDFPIKEFRRGLEKALDPLELKDRMRLLADRIEAGLPSHPPVLFPILVKCLPVNKDDSNGLRGFLVWPLSEIVARRGLGHFKESMAALREITRWFTSEFAIRPFLREQRTRTLDQLRKWCADPDEHVRRLVSEGSRPLLPWGERLPELMADPSLTLPLLEKLHRDPSDYVRLSVANHLNDFSKVHPEVVVETLAKWRVENPGDPKFEKLARHACRTLVKQGHSGALTLHGYGCAKALKLVECTLLNTTVTSGGTLGYRMIVRNTSREIQRALFDYAILHRKANGTLTPKVFKGRIRDLAPGETWEIEGRHSFKPVTTRVYRAGLHGFEPRLNGLIHPAVQFHLEV